MDLLRSVWSTSTARGRSEESSSVQSNHGGAAGKESNTAVSKHGGDFEFDRIEDDDDEVAAAAACCWWWWKRGGRGRVVWIGMDGSVPDRSGPDLDQERKRETTRRAGACGVGPTYPTLRHLSFVSPRAAGPAIRLFSSPLLSSPLALHMAGIASLADSHGPWPCI